MAVLHITYKYNRETSEADYDGFYKVITSYGWARLSQSNWTINTNEPPQAVWQKLIRHIDPNDYLVMLPLDAVRLVHGMERLLNGFCPVHRC
jgi:hypothetical protein